MKIFSPALKRRIKECILSLFWPRKDIYEFFRDCTVPSHILKRIEKWDEQGLSRAGMIDQVFADLANQPGNGTVQFQVILETLVSWDHFDNYWFFEQGKLDINSAKKNIADLSIAKERDLDRLRKAVDQRRTREIRQEERHHSLADMRADFSMIATGSATPQARGYALEQFLMKMARFFDLQVATSFQVNGTQIDGTIKYEGEHYNIEAKWHDRRLSDEPILGFCHKQEMNMHGRGIFISINGYTEGALSMLERSSIKNTILVDGEDLMLVLDELITLPALFDAKIHAAQTRGQFFIHPITKDSKIPRT